MIIVQIILFLIVYLPLAAIDYFSDSTTTNSDESE